MTASTPPQDITESSRRWWRSVWFLAVLGLAVERVANLVVIQAWLRYDGLSWSKLLDHDVKHYIDIVARGYLPFPPPDGLLPDVVFFPGYPIVLKAVDVVSGGHAFAGGFVLSFVASCAAAAAIAILISAKFGARAGILSAWIWGLLPSAAALTIPMSESLFVACAAWALVFMSRRSWWWAAAFAAAAGATRPVGGVLVIAMIVAMLVPRSAARPRVITGVACVLIAAAGPLLAISNVARITGSPTMWLHLEHDYWKSGFDGGISAVQNMAYWFVQPEPSLPFLVSSLTVIAFIVLIIIWLRTRPPAYQAVYVLIATFIVLTGADYFSSKPRFLLAAAFPALAPLGRLLARASNASLMIGGVGLLIVATWWNTWLLIPWPWAL